ncbi:cysteine desulfurase [bacterium]|jgi:cysteine desulfurase|nr:cysteine desulfurase [bacterium]
MSAKTYLDSNAGAPLRPLVVEKLLSVFAETRAGSVLLPNPSSIHAHGRQAKRWIAEAREAVAASLGSGTDPEQVLFTSSGTEANQQAIRSVLEPALSRNGRATKPHWILTPVEHDSVLQMVSWFQEQGGEVSYLPVDAQGLPHSSELENLWRPETVLLSVIAVNNETGAITDLAPLVQTVRARGARIHVDAAQAWGKIPLDLKALDADLVTFSAHKIGALAGVGVVWIHSGVRMQALMRGKQEKGRRGGTENLLGIISAGAAAALVNPEKWSEEVGPWRDLLQKKVVERIPGTFVNAGLAPRIAGTLNLNFEGVEGESMVMALDLAGYSVSSGSACASGVVEPSHVLMAMGRSKSQAMAAIRISLSEALSEQVCEDFVSALERIVSKIRASQGIGQEKGRIRVELGKEPQVKGHAN